MKNIKKIIKEIENRIKKTVKKARKDGVVLGLSGGLDSAVTCKLCVNALGNNKILPLLMPSIRNQDYHDAIKFIEVIDVPRMVIKPLWEIDILNVLDNDFEYRQEKIALGNLKARMRMIFLYFFANVESLLVAGTGNKSELSVGYFTKYGDGACDFLPIGDLYKTEVREIAKELQIPQDIIDKVPSAGLWEGQTDEEEIGLKYELLDRILMEINNKYFLDLGYEKAVNSIAHKANVNIEDVLKVINLMESTSHKRKTPEIIRLRLMIK